MNRSPWKLMAESAWEMTKEKQTLNQNPNRLLFTRAPSAARRFRQRGGLLVIPQGTYSTTQLTNVTTQPCFLWSLPHYSLPKSFRNVPYLLPHRCDGVRIRAPIWRRGGQGGLEYVCAVEGCSSNGAAFSKMYEIWFINVQFSMSIIMLDWLLLGTVWGRTSTQSMSMKTKRWEVS